MRMIFFYSGTIPEGLAIFLKLPLHQIASLMNEMQPIKNVSLPPQQVPCSSSVSFLQHPLLMTKAFLPPPCNSELFRVNENK